MKYRLPRHAEWEIGRRQIPSDWLTSVLERPQQRIRQPTGTDILQSRFTGQDGKMFLLRAVVNTATDPAVVVTVYRTSKIEKYWRPE